MAADRRSAEAAACTPGQGVGGRQALPSPRPGGGGYLDERTPPEVAAPDLRLREFAEIGLSATWLKVAGLLGYDTFVELWRLLSSDPALRDDDNQIALRLRPFDRYERYQRNRYIETLVAAGLDAHTIWSRIQTDIGERLSLRHVKRLQYRYLNPNEAQQPSAAAALPQGVGQEYVARAVASGTTSVAQIRAAMQRDLGISFSHRHMKRLVARYQRLKAPPPQRWLFDA